MSQMPLIHKLAYKLSRSGFVGMSYVWKFAHYLGPRSSDSIIRLPSGMLLRRNHRDWTAKTIYEGTYERPLIKFLEGLQFKGLCIDVGANIGSTLFAAMKGNTTAKFLAFEPSTQCHASLEMVVGDLSSIGEIAKIAIGDSVGEGSLYGSNNPLHSGAASLMNLRKSLATQDKVRIETLDNYLGKKFGTLDIDVSLIKVDTEGYESQVFAGAKELLKSCSSEVIIFEISPSFHDSSWISSLNELLLGKYLWYEICEVGIIRMKPILKEIALEEVLRATHQFNLVLVRKDCLASISLGFPTLPLK